MRSPTSIFFRRRQLGPQVRPVASDDAADFVIDGQIADQARRKPWGNGVTISAADEKIFILSDEIINHIHGFFPAPNGHNERTKQACAALQAIINVIGMVLYEIDCPHCLELTTKAVEKSFVQMLKDVPVARAEVEGEQRAQSVH
jgi:hypothetical protein